MSPLVCSQKPGTTATAPASTSTYTYLDGDNAGEVICEEFLSFGCTDINACNYLPGANANDGTCDYLTCLVFDCANEQACNYNPLADFDDGTCDFESCAGCTLEGACNYDPEATISTFCDYTSCVGCTEEGADNYDPATIDGACVFTGCTCRRATTILKPTRRRKLRVLLVCGLLERGGVQLRPHRPVQRRLCLLVPGYDCDGVCLDDDDDGVRNFDEVEGCTDAEAFNYDPLATDDDGSCEAVMEGCTLQGACN